MRLSSSPRASSSSPVRTSIAMVELAGADPRRAFLEDPDRRDHSAGEEDARQDRQPEAQHEDDGAPDDRGAQGSVRVGGGALDEDEPPEGSDGRVRGEDPPAAEAVGDHGHGGARVAAERSARADFTWARAERSRLSRRIRLSGWATSWLRESTT